MYLCTVEISISDSVEENNFMLKKWIFYGSIMLIVGFLSSGFKTVKTQNQNLDSEIQNEAFDYLLPSLKPENYVATSIPYTGKFFIAFKEAVAFKESRGQYHKVNTLGYLGKYQFGLETLKSLGITDSLSFLSNPKLQEKAFVTNLKRNKYELQKEILNYSGKIIGGVKITESGILAAAHLGGAGSVRKFLKSNGKLKCSDAYGSTVKSYLKQFSGFETKGLIADNKARV